MTHGFVSYAVEAWAVRALAIILTGIIAAVAIAAIVWTVSRGHVFLFPLVLLFGVPFVPLLNRRDSGK